MLEREGTIKGEHDQTLGLSSGYPGTKHLGLNNPQTLYFGCLSAPRGEEHNQNGQCDLFVNMHVPRPFWRTFS